MGIKKDHFKNLFGSGKMKLRIKTFGCEIEIDAENVGEKLDIAQDVLDTQIWEDVQIYMPHQDGNLINETGTLNKTTRGEVYLYPPESDYGHYQYEGIKYVDPEYNIGAFYSPDYGFWSRPGIEKIPSDEKLTYSKPTAVSHWGDEAIENHKDSWIQVVKNVFNKG